MERPLTKEEFEALSKELNEVLVKHGAVMGVKSTIELTKLEDGDEDKTETDSKAEESGESDSGKPA